MSSASGDRMVLVATWDTLIHYANYAINCSHLFRRNPCMKTRRTEPRTTAHCLINFALSSDNMWPVNCWGCGSVRAVAGSRGDVSAEVTMVPGIANSVNRIERLERLNWGVGPCVSTIIYLMKIRFTTMSCRHMKSYEKILFTCHYDCVKHKNSRCGIYFILFGVVCFY